MEAKKYIIPEKVLVDILVINYLLMNPDTMLQVMHQLNIDPIKGMFAVAERHRFLTQAVHQYLLHLGTDGTEDSISQVSLKMNNRIMELMKAQNTKQINIEY